MSLNGDIITDILGRVDGLTLANAGCVSSHFCSIATQESLWEEKCCSLWPSIESKDVKELISSSLGGFRNFYANCFPFIASDESCERDSTSSELKPKVCDAVPSDFVSVVDVAYKNKVIYSKVVWGIPCTADDFEGCFCNCPFRMELINFSDGHHTMENELPTIDSLDELKMGCKFLGQLMDDIRLSWIVINRRTGQAANLSSCSPLAEQNHWASDKGFEIHFGSILPAHSILPCKFVECILVIKCRVSDRDHTSLKITELSMQLEDMMEAQVNGRNSLLILERALGCRRSKDITQISEFYQQYWSEQTKLKESKMRNEGYLDALCLLSGIVASASFWYFVFIEAGAIMGF